MTTTDGDRMPDVDVAATAPSSAVARKRGVLVVDNSAAVRDLLDDALRQFGFAVWLAEDGAAAVEAFRRHEEDIHAILMDVRMPGLNGPQALAAIRLFCPRVPCCFMTGDLGGYSGEDLMALGARAVLVKPFRIDDVARALDGLTAASVEV